MTSPLRRLARMDRAELTWRVGAAVRTQAQRALTAIGESRWKREELAQRLTRLPQLREARTAVARGRWDDAQRLLSDHFARRQPWFEDVWPHDVDQSLASAGRIVNGEYDLLAYRGLRFDGWHHDPVHGAHAPKVFWSQVPFLDAACGDHKVIWELNRHQHWITLGRAFQHTGDARYRDRFIDEFDTWMRDNPPLVGINWASMLELAFRSISWMWALQMFRRGPWIVDLLLGLDHQLRHVERNLSYYFSPNTHLLGEALGLYAAGQSLPELAASGRWVATGRRILLEEIARQIEGDGGHCERSTHYHRYTLDFYLFALSIARRTGDRASAAFERAVARLSDAARILADDNGRLPHIGDDDAGRLMPAPGRAVDDISDSLEVAARLLRTGESPIPDPESLQSAALPETGYFVSRASGSHHLVVDGGPHGYQNCGHAHADSLSLTLSIGGVPLFIDPGTGCYTVDADTRDRLRSTALHNTLVLDDRSQSTSHGPFHWSQIARTRVHRWQAADGVDHFDGSHDGYAPLVHRRRVLAVHGALILVADFVEGSGEHAAAVHWHIDPRWDVNVHGRRAAFRDTGRRVDLVTWGGTIEAFSGDEAAGLGWHSPAYGRIEPATTLRVSRRAHAPFWITAAIDLQAVSPIADLEQVPVWAEAGTLAHAAAFRITRDDSTDWAIFTEPLAVRRSTCGVPIRAADIETDARALFLRVTRDRRVERVAVVDGTFIRFAGADIRGHSDVRDSRVRRSVNSR